MKEIDKHSLARERIRGEQFSPFRTYMELTVGQVGLLRFLLYEVLTSLLGPMPGGTGFYLRKKFYPLLFKRVGRGLIIGRNVVIRHPNKIELGDNVTIDDNCLIDARGAGHSGVVFEDQIIINRNCMVQAKAGPIKLGKRTSIGSNCLIVSIDGIELGEAVLTGAGCSISAGSYHFDDDSLAVMDQGLFANGPIRIGSNSWLGFGVIVLDGVTIGDGAVIGAGAMVNKDIPENAIAFGVPAKVQRIKGEKSTSS
jgi:acetyltransferase-like isoleucine patch superfamily enzyme